MLEERFPEGRLAERDEKHSELHPARKLFLGLISFLGWNGARPLRYHETGYWKSSEHCACGPFLNLLQVIRGQINYAAFCSSTLAPRQSEIDDLPIIAR